MIRIAFGLLSMPVLPAYVSGFWMIPAIGLIRPGVFLGYFVFYYVLYFIMVVPAFLALIKLRRLTIWNYIAYSAIVPPLTEAAYVYFAGLQLDFLRTLFDVFAYYGMHVFMGALAGLYFWCAALWRNPRYLP